MKNLLPLFICLLGMSMCRKPPATASCVDPHFFSSESSRSFKMGFTTWMYAPDLDARTSTYTFINSHTDIYSEQVDDKIPWQALLNNEPLPSSFVNDITHRASLRPPGKQLLLSVSLLNINRTDLLEDVDGSVPAYTTMDDPRIAEAYYKLLVYLTDQFKPDYLVIAMEVNELLVRVPAKWKAYKSLVAAVKTKLDSSHPNLPLSESVTLHNWFKPDVADLAGYQSQIKAYVNSLDFAAISFYPFLKGQHSKQEFQEAFDFLHREVSIPIAFSETAHIAEPLSVPALGISINGNECEQNAYLETLFMNAQKQHYLFLIWWSHRDYDALWNIFPDSTKDIGLLWRDTGILDQDGHERPAFSTWVAVQSK